jgi:hypothetical protein
MLGRDGQGRSPTATSERRGISQRPALLGAGRNTAVSPMIVALCLAAVFVTCRLVTMDGDPSRFVVAGRVFVDPGAAPKSLHVERGKGYDGQFFYRLALAPADLQLTAHGVRLDTPLRRQRVGYPMLAWLVSAGRPGLVVWALLLVNILGLGVLGLLGGLAAQQAGRHAMWGLIVPGFPGFVMTIARDLSEITAACFVLSALLALRRQRPLVTGVLLSAAVLTRESTMVVVVAVAAVDVIRRWRQWRHPRAADGDHAGVPSAAAAWALPILAFLAWQLAVVTATGSTPLLDDTSNLSLPFAALLPAAMGWLTAGLQPGITLRFALLAMLMIMALLVVASLRRTSARPQERLAWASYLVLAVSLSRDIWVDPADFRTLAELHVTGALVLLGDPRRRLGLPAVALAAGWFATAAFRAMVV